MFPFPRIPEVPQEQTATATGSLRYEDVAQDGTLILTALAHFMGETVFHGLLRNRPEARANAFAGIVPILTRLTLLGGGGPVSVRRPVTATGGYQMGHTVGADGAVERLILNTWVSMTAPIGRTNPPQPPNAGEPIAVGSVFGEHVLTRPFVPRESRRVLVMAPGPWPEVPPARLEWRGPGDLLQLPSGARWVDAALEEDEAPIVFTLAHTDSNQHVNSLVYPRLFEEAVVRRLAARGREVKVLARFVETAYRKPCFAGQRMRIMLRLWEREEAVGAVGAFVPEEDRAAKPHAVSLLAGAESLRMGQAPGDRLVES